MLVVSHDMCGQSTEVAFLSSQHSAWYDRMLLTIFLSILCSSDFFASNLVLYEILRKFAGTILHRVYAIHEYPVAETLLNLWAYMWLHSNIAPWNESTWDVSMWPYYGHLQPQRHFWPLDWIGDWLIPVAIWSWDAEIRGQSEESHSPELIT